MNSMIHLEPLKPASFEECCRLGEQAYREHYLHLWPNSDPSPYLESSFTGAILKKEYRDPNAVHFIIRKETTGIGILKLQHRTGIDGYKNEAALLLEKIYLIRAYTGKGYGKIILTLVEAYARDLEKKSILLDTMKKGRALSFYKNYGFRVVEEKELPFQNALQEEKGMYLLCKEL